MIKQLLRKWAIGATLAATMLASGAANAATATTTFAVTATVASNCIINSASALAFGTYTPGAGNVDQTSTIIVRCTNGTPYGIGLDAGNATGSTLAQRTMRSATTTTPVNYALFTDNLRTISWQNPANAGAVAGNQGGTGTPINRPL